jgi:alpha-galactosidase
VSDNAEITAVHIAKELVLSAKNPAPEWQSSTPISFVRDWRGENSGGNRETTVRALWSERMLYLRFDCRHHEIFVYSDSDPSGRRDHLWDRDVVEAFLQPDPSREHFYKEFEIAPNGMWIDLDIFPSGMSDLQSGLHRSVFIDEKMRLWSAELAIPIKALTASFDPSVPWRANFYRIEGPAEPRSYLAWQPTKTPEPNFHVPSAFGRLRFAR